MIIVDEFHPNLEKTTSTTPSVILSNLCIFFLNRDDTQKSEFSAQSSFILPCSNPSQYVPDKVEGYSWEDV